MVTVPIRAAKGEAGAFVEQPLSGQLTPSRRAPAWLLSTALHTALFVVAALTIGTPQRGPRTEPDRVTGIALVARSAAGDVRYFSDAGSAAAAGSPLVNQAASAESPTAIAMDSLNLSPAFTLPTGSAAPAPSGAGEIAGAEGVAPLGNGRGTGAGLPGGQTRTGVFGAEGAGSKFVYVFDRSASMDGFGGRPMRAARRELLNSLNDLQSVHQFQIIFYNERPTVFNPQPDRPPTILFASDENKERARSFVERMPPQGATRHLEALVLALGLAPDVIFFLTDAADPQLTPRELEELRRRNRSGTVIHAVEFGSGPFQGGDNFLTKLARQHGGQHVYVDVTGLK